MGPTNAGCGAVAVAISFALEGWWLLLGVTCGLSALMAFEARRRGLPWLAPRDRDR
jgi:hypothetical protein